MTSDDDENSERKSRSAIRASRFFVWYGNRRRRGMLDDARLSLREFLAKIGLIFAFMLLDLIFFPSVIQIFIPISTAFYAAWAAGGLLVVFAEKKMFDRILPPRKIPTSNQ
jgi:hypothetical protein